MKAIVIATVFACSLAASADNNTWWVDDGNYGKEGLDGKSAGTAYGTIQDALDNPDFAAGDTVKVLPGVYDKGETFVAGDGVTNRVRISKACTIVSTGGKGVTAIVGKHSSATTYGCGQDAIRCICAAVTDGVRIEGFTIRDGATDSGTGESATHYGGGIHGAKNDRNLVVVECDILNCTGWKGAAARYATLVRCYETGNNSTGSQGSINNAVSLHSCVVAWNTSSGYTLSTCGAVNTTIIGNSRGITGNGSYYNCLLCANEGSERNSGTYYNFTCTASNGAYQVFAPALGDYRPVVGSGADGTGNATYLTKLSTVPSTECHLDFYGNPFPETGACNIGAVQGTVNPQGGALKAGGDLIVDGQPIKSGRWLFAETYPTQWNVKASVPDGKWLWGFSRGDVEVNRFHPDLNGDAFMMPPPTGVCTTTPVFASRAYWVDPRKDAQGADIGSDSNNGSEAAPFKTLQKAINKSGGSTYTMIFAAEGRYEEGGRCIDESQKNNMVLTNRICAVNDAYYVRIVGAGPGKSFVCGAPDPDTGGNGPRAVRPIGIYCNSTTVQGFTLTDGYCGTNSAPAVDRYGAVYGRTRGGVHVLDCEITNCRGLAGVANQATFTRCRFHDNETGGYVASASALISCLLDGNRITGAEGGVLKNSLAVNCTLQGAADGQALSYNNNTIHASILDTCTKLYSADSLSGTLIWKVGTAGCTGDWTVGNPYFVDPANGDWRVRSFSKAVTCAGVPSADNYGATYWKYAMTDYAGKPLAFRNGAPVAGCRQEVEDEPGILIEAAAGGVAGATEGWHSFADGESATLSMGEGTRPCVGYTLGGVTNLFDETPSRTLTAADVPSGALVEAIYSNDWYVDANAADDTGFGFTPGSAKKTFAGLFGTELVKSGDTVHAAEGTYDSGVMHRGDDEVDSFKQPYTTGSRVIVPSGVTVVADGRVEETVIKGAPATISPSATYGLGDDAVRCVSLRPDSRIRGFTLTDGRTAMKTGRTGWTDETPKNYYDNIGGAVVGTGTTSAGTQVAERCILKDCAARRGGGAAYVRLVNCRVTGMYASDNSGNGTSTYRSQHYGTVITGGKSTYAVMYPGSFIFSTVVDSYSNALYQPSSLIGSIVVGASAISSGSSLKISNTLLTSTPKNATAEKNFTNGTAIVTAAELALDAEGRPTPRTSCALEQGDETLFDTYRTVLGGGETDATGVPRILNGHLDIGALEGDWRKTYAQDIGVRKLTVESADPAVVESQDETVLVPEGATLAGGLRNTTGRPYEFLLRFTVPAEGSLTLTAGDSSETYAEGTHERRLTCEGDYLPLAFASTAGTAKILRGQSLAGVLMIVR